MGYAFKIGEVCALRNSYMLDGELIFRKDEEVRIEDIDPDPLSPGSKYVVRSVNGDCFRLSGLQLKRNYCPECGAMLTTGSTRCSKCYKIIPGREDLSRPKRGPGPTHPGS